MDGQETVLARFPAPVDYTPKGSRNPRLDLVAHTAPVRLTHARPDTFEPCDLPLMGLRGEPPRIFRDGNGLWSPHMKWHGGDDFETIPGRRVAEYLADGGGYEFARAFIGTPANARLRTWDTSRWGKVEESHPYPHAIGGRPGFRGIEADLDAAREIRWDGRAKAAEALQAHLDRNVRIVGDEAFFRRNDMALATWVTLDTGSLYRSEPTVDPPAIETGMLLAAPENLDALLAYVAESGDGIIHGRSYDFDAWRRAVPVGLSRDEDAVLVANGACLMLRRCLDRCMAAARAQGENGARATEGLDALRTEARRAEAWSWTRSFGRGDPEGAVEWLLGAMDATGKAWNALKVRGTDLMALQDRERSLRWLYLPILRPEPAAEDVENLSAAAARIG